MGAFEVQAAGHGLSDSFDHPGDCGVAGGHEHGRVKDECIIAFKIYDSCRHQQCLTPADIGPSRAAECGEFGGEKHKEGDIIKPPANAATVTIDQLRTRKIIIVDKQPCPFKQGYWDVDLKFVFEYRLTFREVDGKVISQIKASSIFNMKLSLFGSTGNELSIGTDLFKSYHDSSTFEAEPFIWAEAKAIALHAAIHRGHHFDSCDEGEHGRHGGHRPNEVWVTLGLFSIINLFRVVNLSVESRGFCVPKECEDVSPISPCEYFGDLDFPMDIFTPPQKPEFLAGVSGNIAKKK
jgi:hypothetical protein